MYYYYMFHIIRVITSLLAFTHGDRPSPLHYDILLYIRIMLRHATHTPLSSFSLLLYATQRYYIWWHIHWYYTPLRHADAAMIHIRLVLRLSAWHYAIYADYATCRHCWLRHDMVRLLLHCHIRCYRRPSSSRAISHCHYADTAITLHSHYLPQHYDITYCHYATPRQHYMMPPLATPVASLHYAEVITPLRGNSMPAR